MTDQTSQPVGPSRRSVVRNGAIGAGLVLLGGGAVYLTRHLAHGGAENMVFDNPLPEQWEYDLTGMQQVDPALIGYHAVKNDGDGNADREKLNEQYADWFTEDQQVLITGVAKVGDRTYLADARGRCIWQFDNRKPVGRIGKPRYFVVPSPYFDVAADPDGQSIWVTNPGRHRVERYTLDGELISWFGKPGTAIEKFCGCCNPCGIAVLGDGNVVTSEKGLPRVKVYAPDGRLESVVAPPKYFAEQADAHKLGGGSKAGLDLAVDSSDRIYVYDRMTGQTHCFEKNK